MALFLLSSALLLLSSAARASLSSLGSKSFFVGLLGEHALSGAQLAEIETTITETPSRTRRASTRDGYAQKNSCVLDA